MPLHTLCRFLLLALLVPVGCAKSPDPNAQLVAQASATPTVSNIDASEFDRLRREKNYTIIDVRSAEEFASGHIPNAILIDINSPDFDGKIAALDPNRPYLVHCRSGRRSAVACSRMMAAGFKQLYHLEGGTIAWEAAGMPLEKQRAAGPIGQVR